MISVKQARWFCADDISLIPNYKEAIESDEVWDCHHVNEIQPDGTIASAEHLIRNKVYYKRPWWELVFVSHVQHAKMHDDVNKAFKLGRHSKEAKKKSALKQTGRVGANKGKKYSEETRRRMSEAAKKRPEGYYDIELLRANALKMKGKPGRKHTDEAKKKLSAIAKSRGPEYWEKWKKARQEKIRLRKMKEGIVV